MSFFLEFTVLTIGENVSLYAKSGPILSCNVYPVLNISALLVKLHKFATKNWMCNNVTSVFSKLSLYCMDQSYLFTMVYKFASTNG